eukprot:NP_510706.3 Uncharacterized protein CELE_T01C8.3 [Caenorhabditis elegans]
MQLLENCNFRCTNCTGDYCYAVNYKHLNPSLKNEQSYYQGCFTSPTDLPLGCSTNSRGSIFCICNSTDYCNEMTNVKEEKNITYLICEYAKDSMFRGADCVQPWCVKTASSYMDEMVECGEGTYEMEMYDIGFVYSGMLLPINSCYAVADDSRYDKSQICTYKVNKTTPYKLKVPGSTKCFAPGEVMTRMKNSTCIGQFCYSASAVFGCISQFNREGAILKVTIFHFEILNKNNNICLTIRNFCKKKL